MRTIALTAEIFDFHRMARTSPSAGWRREPPLRSVAAGTMVISNAADQNGCVNKSGRECAVNQSVTRSLRGLNESCINRTGFHCRRSGGHVAYRGERLCIDPAHRAQRGCRSTHGSDSFPCTGRARSRTYPLAWAVFDRTSFLDVPGRKDEKNAVTRRIRRCSATNYAKRYTDGRSSSRDDGRLRPARRGFDHPRSYSFQAAIRIATFDLAFSSRTSPRSSRDQRQLDAGGLARDRQSG